jgi:NAD(P)-dependent dehydrogenase (short-subunit alcohol dehydrogenase family)
MQNSSMPVVLITGASSGIGFTCAKTLHAHGYRVFGTSRRSFDHDFGFKLLRMDVGNEDSVNNAVQRILEETGRIDIVVNNAGIGYGGAIEDTSLAEAKATLETNFFGVLNVCRAVLPSMRSLGGGLIVNISSIGGLVGLPFQGLYSASKFAVEGMTEALRLELKSFGVKVVLINPGDIATSFTQNRRICRDSVNASVYDAQFQRALNIIEQNETSGSTPELVAKTLLKIVRSTSPNPRYVAGTLIERLAVLLRRILPAVWFEWVLAKYYGM